MRALRFAYPADFFRSGKREARRVLAKIDGKVVFAAELIPCDAAARHGGEHGIPQGGKAGLRICGGVRVGERFRPPAARAMQHERPVFPDDGANRPLAENEVAPAGRPPGDGNEPEARIRKRP